MVYAEHVSPQELNLGYLRSRLSGNLQNKLYTEPDFLRVGKGGALIKQHQEGARDQKP